MLIAMNNYEGSTRAGSAEAATELSGEFPL
jgi:hypothetical protein